MDQQKLLCDLGKLLDLSVHHCLCGERKTLTLDLSASEPALTCDLGPLGLGFPIRDLGTWDGEAPDLGEQKRACSRGGAEVGRPGWDCAPCSSPLRGQRTCPWVGAGTHKSALPSASLPTSSEAPASGARRVVGQAPALESGKHLCRGPLGRACQAGGSETIGVTGAQGKAVMGPRAPSPQKVQIQILRAV